jgi:hypothetical protein
MGGMGGMGGMGDMQGMQQQLMQNPAALQQYIPYTATQSTVKDHKAYGRPSECIVLHC